MFTTNSVSNKIQIYVACLSLGEIFFILIYDLSCFPCSDLSMFVLNVSFLRIRLNGATSASYWSILDYARLRDVF